MLERKYHAISDELGNYFERDLECKTLRRKLTFYYALSRGAKNKDLHNITIHHEMFSEVISLDWGEK